MTLSLVSLGCAKNAVDLQVRTGNLLKEGCSLSSNPDRADTVIVNTCAFIAAAREEAEREIRRALELKRRGNFGRVVVTGCYPERYPDARAKFPGVDVWEGVPHEWIEPKMPALRLTGKAFAYLKIAEGCAHRCAYCAIPAIRGNYRSRPMSAILKEAKALLATGCKELNIVAQDPMLWREVVPRASCLVPREEKHKARSTKHEARLPDLLWKLDKLPGDFWIRVLYSYPSELSDDYVIWLMTANHAVHYADVPLQHTVPEVLAKMNRRRAIDATLTCSQVLRDLIPDITLRTTIMTGFPGETARRFERMRSDLKRMQFDHLGAFAFSPEEGTKAAKMSGRPSRAVAEARERIIMADAEALWKVKASRMLGETHRALVVAPGIARMASQAPDVDGVVLLREGIGNREQGIGKDVGEFVDVKLVKVKGFDFVGEVQ